MKKPNTPKVTKGPETPSMPDRQPVGMGDTFKLPSFISQADRENFYFRWMKDDRWTDLEPAGYTQVKDPNTGNTVKKPTKDSDSDLILVRLPIKYRNEDLKAKADRVRDNSNDAGTIPGVESYLPKG